MNSMKGADLIDVRTEREFRSVHAPGARLAPLDQLDATGLMELRNGRSGEPLYVICKGGTRARMACEKFVAAGFPGVFLVDGGMDAWQEAGLPVNRGQKMMSVDCQVRVGMGSLVLAGLGLGVFVNPGFLAISALVGCGMVYAGIADDCPMATVVTMMPWNRSRQGQSCCTTGR
jgi:rhodanese-related sulfurtransferase